MVYQEQIMQVAQVLGGYSLGAADLLRRAMGKKKVQEMQKHRGIFVKGAKENHDIQQNKAEEIFDIMARFAEYGFNRSHSAAYSIVAYQTAYLKANYTAPYMAAVLSNTINNLEKISFFINECKKMNIPVYGPDVNESNLRFTVNEQGAIRFGLQQLEEQSEMSMKNLIDARKKDGKYKSVWDLTERVEQKLLNKKTLEGLIYSGALDSLDTGINRAQYFHVDVSNTSGVEKLIKYGQQKERERNTSQAGLFSGGAKIDLPKLPSCNEWDDEKKLMYEKEATGFYFSGHPLDNYQLFVEDYCIPIGNWDNMPSNTKMYVAGVTTECKIREFQDGNGLLRFKLEDLNSNYCFELRGDKFHKYKDLLFEGKTVLLELRKNHDRHLNL